MISLVERFYSIQGEGHQAGLPMYFVRTKGCDVGCEWCDTKYSWEVGDPTPQNVEKGGGMFTPEQIVKMMVEEAPEARWMCLTGGEPMMQPAADLLELDRLLAIRGKRLHVETSGVYPIPFFRVPNHGSSPGRPYICCSPKQTVSPKYKMLSKDAMLYADEFKIVFPAFGGVDLILRFIMAMMDIRREAEVEVRRESGIPYAAEFNVSIQPEFYEDQKLQGEITRECINVVQRLGSNVRLSVQQHKKLAVR